MAKLELVLQHETRRMLYQHIIAHPGVSFNILKNIFDLTNGTLRYHLDYLKRSEKISFGLDERKREYYPHHLGTIIPKNTNQASNTHRLNHYQELIINTLKRKPEINQKQLSKTIGINRFILRNNLNKLIDLGMVRKIVKKKIVCYEYISNGHMQFEILKTLVIKLINGEITEREFLELKSKVD